MRYKNYILSKGDKVKLKTSGENWLPSMTKKYGGKVVTIKDFIPYINVFECEPLEDDLVGYFFSYDDIDEVVYCKNDEEKTVSYKKHDKKMSDELSKQLVSLQNEYDALKAETLMPSCRKYSLSQLSYMRSELIILKSLIDIKLLLRDSFDRWVE